MKPSGFEEGSEIPESGSVDSGSGFDETIPVSEKEVVGFPLVGSDEWENGIPYLGLPTQPFAPNVDPLAPDVEHTVSVVSPDVEDTVNVASGAGASAPANPSDPKRDNTHDTGESFESDAKLTPIVLPEPILPAAKAPGAPLKKDASVWPGLEYSLPSMGMKSQLDSEPAVDAEPSSDPVPVTAPEPSLDPEPARDPEPAAAPEPELPEIAEIPAEPALPVIPVVLEVPEFSADPVPQVAPEFNTPPEAQPTVSPGSLPEIPEMPAWTPPAAKQRRKRPVGLVLAIVAVLVAFGGGYAVRAVTTPAATEALGQQQPLEAAPELVQTYLEALAAGDAETARSINGASESETMLSSEVLKQSNELAPMSEISVGEAAANGDEAEVSATFALGEATMDRTFRLRNTSAGWQLADGLVPLSVPALAGFDAQLNGAELSSTEVRVFPGMYRLALGSSAFTLGADAETVMITDAEQALAVRQLQPKLTDDASAKYVELVRASLNECLALTDLATPCGLDVSARLKDGATPVEGTAKRSLDSEGEAALDALVIQMDPAAAGTVFSILNIQVKTRLEAENNGSRVSGELLYGGQLLSPRVDFTAETPVVVWQ